MDAKDSDEVGYGAPLTLPPFLDEGPRGRLQATGGQITIGGTNLRDYTNNNLNASLNLVFFWRNTKPTTYILNGRQYIDASRPRDLPDFRIVNVDLVPAILAFTPLAVCRRGASNRHMSDRLRP